MEGQSALEIVAEVSVALAGFTGVVAAFGSRGGRGWTALDVLRFKMMLGTSLGALLFSLLPMALHHLGLTESTTWATSSALLLLFLVGNAVRDVRFSRTPEVRDDPAFSPLLGQIVGAIMIATTVLLTLNLIGVGYEREFGPYLAGLLALLVASTIMFVRLLSFIGREQGGAAE